MTSPLFKLSQEVVDHIVDFVDQESLVQCALAHRVFLYRSQSRLFSTIYLSSDRLELGDRYRMYRQKRINSFLEILQVSPHIARYVRGLSLQISSFDNYWVTEEHIFLDMLDILKRTGSRIETLCLIGLSFPEKLSDARLFEQNFLEPFISSSLTTLVISGILDIPISLITNSPNLRNLKTFRSSIESFGDNLDLALLHCSPKIRNLHYLPPDATIESVLFHNTASAYGKTNCKKPNCSPRLYASVFVESMTKYHFDLPPFADLTGLRSITAVTRDLDVLQSIIQKSRHSLQELYLFESTFYLDESIRYKHDGIERIRLLADHLNLSEVRGLRALTMDVVFRPSARCGPVEDTCNVLKTIPAQNLLEDITLNFFIGFETSSSDILANVKVDWKCLDDEITRIAQQKPLHLCFQLTYQMPESESQWGSDSDDDPYDTSYLDREREKIKTCGDVLRKLPEESFPKINSTSSISLDYTYTILPE